MGYNTLPPAASARFRPWCSADTALGLGKYWLYRAQPLLARIYDAEASVTKGCSAGSVASGITNRALSAAANEDAWSPTLEQLRHRPEYVEARGLLNAATSFYARAVSNTPSSDPSYGYLLVEVRPTPCGTVATGMLTRAPPL